MGGRSTNNEIEDETEVEDSEPPKKRAKGKGSRVSNERGDETEVQESEPPKKSVKGKGKATGRASTAKPAKQLSINLKAPKRQPQQAVDDEYDEDEIEEEVPAKHRRADVAGKVKKGSGAAGKAKKGSSDGKAKGA